MKIYERRGAVMHAKTACIDGVWSTIGSTNLDWRSFLHNDEINAVILGRDFAAQMEAMFADDLPESDAITLEQLEAPPADAASERAHGADRRVLALVPASSALTFAIPSSSTFTRCTLVRPARSVMAMMSSSIEPFSSHDHGAIFNAHDSVEIAPKNTTKATMNGPQ